MDTQNIEVISEKTNISIAWFIGGVVALITATISISLYIFGIQNNAIAGIDDLRSRQGITEVKVNALEQRHNVLEQDIKTDLRRLSDKVDTVIENTHK